MNIARDHEISKLSIKLCMWNACIVTDSQAVKKLSIKLCIWRARYVTDAQVVNNQSVHIECRGSSFCVQLSIKLCTWNVVMVHVVFKLTIKYCKSVWNVTN